MAIIDSVSIGNETRDIQDSKAYHTNDTVEATLADDDKVPFYDTSATEKRNSTWSNIKAKLKTYFDTLYTGNTGTVSSVATGAGLTGGVITDSGTIKTKLKSETLSSLTAADKGTQTGREYAVGLDANGNLSVNIPWDSNSKRIWIYREGGGVYYKLFEHDNANGLLTNPLLISGTMGFVDGGDSYPFCVSLSNKIEGFVDADFDIDKFDIFTTTEGTIFRVYLALYNAFSYADIQVKPSFRGTLYTPPIQESSYQGTIQNRVSHLSPVANVSAIAPFENTGTTAKISHAVGDHFYRNNKFCTAIANIASGETLSLNTNYTEGTVADAIIPYKMSELHYDGIQSTYPVAVEYGGWVVKGKKCYINMLVSVGFDVPSIEKATFPALNNFYVIRSNTLPYPKDSSIWTVFGLLMKYNSSTHRYVGPLKTVSFSVIRDGSSSAGALGITFYDALTRSGDKYCIKMVTEYDID